LDDARGAGWCMQRAREWEERDVTCEDRVLDGPASGEKGSKGELSSGPRASPGVHARLLRTPRGVPAGLEGGVFKSHF